MDIYVKQMNQFMLVAVAILLILAVYWEYKDVNRISARVPVAELTTEDEKKREMEFYATFMSRNHVWWRFNYILCAISFGIMMWLLGRLHPEIRIPMGTWLFLFLVFVLVFHMGYNFKNFHFYRVMELKCANAVIL